MSKYDSLFVGASAAPSGWVKFGSVAVDQDNIGSYPAGFTPGILDSYDTTAYVIVSDTTTAGLVGRTTGGGSGVASANTPTYWVTSAKNDSSFIELAKRLTGDFSLSSASTAKTLLNSSGYWTSYSSGLPPPPPPPPFFPTDSVLNYGIFNDIVVDLGFGETESHTYHPFPGSYGDYLIDFVRVNYWGTTLSATMSASGVSNFFGGYTQGYATYSLNPMPSPQFDGTDIAYVAGTYTAGSDVALVSYADYTTDISFIHASGGSYSIYFVGKPEVFQDALFAEEFVIFSTEDPANTIGPYEKLYVSSAGASQGNTFSVVFETAERTGFLGSKLIINKVAFEVGLTATAYDSQPLRVFSVLGQNVGNTTSHAVSAYVNGVLVASQSHINKPTTNDPSESPYQMFSISEGFEKSRFYKGYFASIYIYDYMHTPSTHNDILTILMTKYGI